VTVDTQAYEIRLAQALPPLRDRIARAAERAGTSPDQVTIVAVTKSHPLAACTAALAAGLRDLGENRVAELADKGAALADAEVNWHLIGHIQSRKAADAAAVADWIHSVDSLKLARRLSDAARGHGRTLSVLVQVNTSGEDAKSGYSAAQAEDEVGDLLDLAGLRVRGLMTMAPYTDDEGVVRTTFRRLRELHERLLGIAGYDGTELSMGMTNDFDVAIEEGSTMIRVGTALFGERT